jgi:hypothetical protein
MTETVPRPDASLPELLAQRARGASDGRLAIDLAAGLLAAAVALRWRPTGWVVLLSAALCFAAFGAWGIADRELGERAPESALARVLRVVRVVATATGALAAVALLLGITATALGQWIS